MTTTITEKICALSLALLAGNSALAGETLSQVWQSKGLKNPESVAYDSAHDVIYVADVDGNPGLVDGVGSVAKLDVKGQMIDKNWRPRISAPKGLAISGKSLYVTDITRLIRIDLETHRATDAYFALDAKFLNDVAVAPDGDIYVSDTGDGAIWKLHGDSFEKWLAADAKTFCRPSGLVAGKESLTVACWQRLDGQGKEGPGPLMSVKYSDKTITALGDGKPIGYLYGLQSDGADGYYLGDWVAGTLLHWTPAKGVAQIAKLGAGIAGFTFLADKNLMLVPFMNDGIVRAYRLTRMPAKAAQL